ncbi:Hypothetical predicted protein [Mytilus galloprovincialis]|uniref:C-type lectin domain-containing protein n=1 Tax=Mytilus galloprovincialis TaxID=29158 RepID=A0A8B6BXY6_MYTGA|nr:Hypothetical predicted protein [Mytilus galloprovincialis]
MVKKVNNDEVVVPMQAEFEIYNAFKNGCSDKGYYYDLSSDTCLKMFVDSHGKTWEHARNHCQRDGGDLISMTTMAKWNFVTHFTSCMSNLWIGLKEERWVTNDIFEYLFNVTVELNRYDHDFQNDPDQSCGTFIPNVGVYDESCNIREKHRYVCEILV